MSDESKPNLADAYSLRRLQAAKLTAMPVTPEPAAEAAPVADPHQDTAEQLLTAVETGDVPGLAKLIQTLMERK